MDIYPGDMPALIEKLRTKARAEYNVRIPIYKLDKEHRSALVRAINNVLATEEAIFTYAQIIDGLPTADVGWDRRVPGLLGDHPLDEHEELCPGAMEKAREVCTKWSPEMLSYDPKPPPGTKMFNTRLIEMVAVALHQFGALLYKLEFRLHKGDVDAIVNWTMPKPDWKKDEDWVPLKPLPTIFNNPAYVNDDIYPEGIADIVGYWAEDRILGGVIVFDRRAEQDKDGDFLTQDPPNVYLHPCRANTTFRVTQLLDHQQQSLADFLLADPEKASSSKDVSASAVPCPIPIIVDDRNRVRVDAEDAILFRGIFRDIWERRPLDREERIMMKRRPQSDLDYPEAQLVMLAANRAAGMSIKGRFKRYLDGDEMMDDGPWKRTLDEYREQFGWEKKIKLDDLAEGGKRDDEVFKKGVDKMEAEEDGEKGKGKEKGGEETKEQNGEGEEGEEGLKEAEEIEVEEEGDQAGKSDL